jgi:hypothetical protein
MATTFKNGQHRAAVSAKEERARDAKLAMHEYEAEKLAIEVKTARLRALRLAKEAERPRVLSDHPPLPTSGAARRSSRTHRAP